MDRIADAARAYIKHHLRCSIATFGPVEGMAEAMAPFGLEVSRRWETVVSDLDLSDPDTRNKLSTVVNKVYVEVVREAPKEAPTFQGLAHFFETFSVDSMLTGITP